MMLSCGKMMLLLPWSCYYISTSASSINHVVCVYDVRIMSVMVLLVLFYIPQRGVQWTQGVVIYLTLYTSLLCNTTPIHCTPDPLHPPLQSIQCFPKTAPTPPGPPAEAANQNILFKTQI